MASNSNFIDYFAAMKSLILFISGAAIALTVLAVSMIRSKNETTENHKNLVLRNIGHQVLLHANDSTSRVLPIEKIDAHTYQISFQNNFAFIPDSLISLVQSELKKSDFPQNYLVSVIECTQKSTIYAFEINAKLGNLTPCTGRKQVNGCYLIQIGFSESNQMKIYQIVGLLVFILMILFYIKYKYHTKIIAPLNLEENTKIGLFKFYPSRQMLQFENKTIKLSEKETKSLTIFIENLNQVIEREKLIKEIWEEEGLIVISRNVDVLVSKLRKKLSDDPSIKFINIHNKGYKLIIES